MKQFYTGFRILLIFGTFLVSCGNRLTDEKAMELIRLNYKQQSITEGAGIWLIDTVQIDQMKKLSSDTPKYAIKAFVSGLYRVPSIEDAPSGLTEHFYDTLSFHAVLRGKVWSAKQWVIIGSRHE
ncbi:MAG: hypothetical protein K2P88_05665 [Chitinophagaceae bacterium]|uniref:hypothetical protein n=1 Tax=unclassified Paraflavitalea TaxID=2798305 RepID=UPI003D351834|nr:hypothetical protein [Chitinophagaceae bacterium]